MISKFIFKLDQALAGAPDETLTVGLLAVAGVCVLIALLGDPLEKAAALAWTVFP